MLKSPPSLALRAGLIFISIYVAVLAAFVATLILSSSFDLGVDRYAGAHVALAIAHDELSETDGAIKLPRNGSFAELAARNPTMWLIAQSRGRSFTFGPVPPAALHLFKQYRGPLDVGRFRVPGVPAGVANAKLERRDIGSNSLLLAAGGVNPATLSAKDALRVVSPLGVLIALVLFAVLGLAAMAVALPLFARAIRPIAAEAGSVVPEDPSRRLDEGKAPRELLPLVRAFNATLDRLGAELARRKRFITDAAHELRTPLAVVSLRVEELPEESPKQELRRGVHRLIHLVAQLLDLERLSSARHQRRPLDLVATARDVVADLAPVAMKAGYEVSLDSPRGPVTVIGDEQVMVRAMTNLIGNSVAHAGGSGHIRVAVRADGTVEVSDEGPGIPPSLLPQLFEPFARGSQIGEGCGLGLHLTRAIMRAHGGDVSLEPSQRGATFRLRFELCEGES